MPFCEECEKEVEDDWVSCPFCSQPIGRPTESSPIENIDEIKDKINVLPRKIEASRKIERLEVRKAPYFFMLIGIFLIYLGFIQGQTTDELRGEHQDCFDDWIDDGGKWGLSSIDCDDERDDWRYSVEKEELLYGWGWGILIASYLIKSYQINSLNPFDVFDFR